MWNTGQGEQNQWRSWNRTKGTKKDSVTQVGYAEGETGGMWWQRSVKIEESVMKRTGDKSKIRVKESRRQVEYDDRNPFSWRNMMTGIHSVGGIWQESIQLVEYDDRNPSNWWTTMTGTYSTGGIWWQESIHLEEYDDRNPFNWRNMMIGIDKLGEKGQKNHW